MNDVMERRQDSPAPDLIGGLDDNRALQLPQASSRNRIRSGVGSGREDAFQSPNPARPRP